MITTLIDKQDTAEIIRDKIALILATETLSQVALATTAGKSDPDEWKLRVFKERANPWENLPTKTGDPSPIVNVWWDTSSFEGDASNISERQKSTTIFNIDCYAYGKSKNISGGGHSCGDQTAAENVHRATRLVRNILMAAQYTYLDLRGIVWRRWVDSITMLQPQQDNQNVHHVVASRLAFRVEFNEFSPQVEPNELCLLNVEIDRAEDGQILVEADYDYTL